jgi:hypothetical protein
MFKITWKVEDDGNDKDDTKETAADLDASAHESGGKHKDKKKKEKEGMSGGKVAAVAVGGVVAGALTAGVGLLAGMVLVGMGAAGGGAAAAMSNSEGKERTLLLASDSYHEAENWVNAIEAQIQDLGDQILGLPQMGGGAKGRKMRSHAVRPEVRLQEVEDWITTSKWKIYDVYEGVRLLQIAATPADTSAPTSPSASVKNSTSAFASIAGARAEGAPCMRVNIGISASTADTFSSIINFSTSLQTGIIRSVRTVESIDNFTDIIHLKLEPMFLYPTWTGEYDHNRSIFCAVKDSLCFATAPRDFCLIRYWRDNFDGSYVICLDSSTHPECPLAEGYVRGELHAAYIVAPPKGKNGVNSPYGLHAAKVHTHIAALFVRLDARLRYELCTHSRTSLDTTFYVSILCRGTGRGRRGRVGVPAELHRADAPGRLGLGVLRLPAGLPQGGTRMGCCRNSVIAWSAPLAVSDTCIVETAWGSVPFRTVSCAERFLAAAS